MYLRRHLTLRRMSYKRIAEVFGDCEVDEMAIRGAPMREGLSRCEYINSTTITKLTAI